MIHNLNGKRKIMIFLFVMIAAIRMKQVRKMGQRMKKWVDFTKLGETATITSRGYDFEYEITNKSDCYVWATFI